MKTKPSTISKNFSTFLIFFLLIQLITGIFLFVPKPQEAKADGASWYNSSWLYRKRITIDHTKVVNVADPSVTYANFPVLVQFTGLDDSKININGTDIRFTASDGITELPREIESYSSGTLNAWTKTTLTKDSSDSANDEIYMYYGNSIATEPAASSTYGSENVWDSNFKMIQHLDEEQAGTDNIDLYQDSTSNANHGNDYVSATGKTGQISSGQQFDGSDDYIVIGIESISNFESSDYDSLGNLYVGYDRRVYKSTDGGVSVLRIFTAPTYPSEWTLYPGKIATLFVDSRDYIFVSSRCSNRLWRSTDGGASFTEVLNLNRAAQDGHIGFTHGMDEDQFGDLYASEYGDAASARLFKSTDGGATWVNIKSWDSRHMHAVAFNPYNNFLYAITGENGTEEINFYRSKDGGITWQYIAHLKITSISFIDEWVYTGDDVQGADLHIRRFQDDGSNGPFTPVIVYTRTTNGSDYLLAATKIGDYLVFTSHIGEGSIIVSSDGTNWNVIREINPATNTYLSGVTYHPNRGGRVFTTIAPDDGGSFSTALNDWTPTKSGTDLDIMGNITVEAWIKPAQISANTDIVSKFTSGTQEGYLLFQLGDDIRFYTKAATGKFASFANFLTVGAWHHLVGLNDEGINKLYVDGIERIAGTVNQSPIHTETNLFIGQRENGANRFNGSIDEVRISNTARSAEWISTEYNNQNNPSSFYAPGLEDGYPIAPTIGTPTALSLSAIRWNFTDNSSYETGFRVYTNADAIATSSATADLTYLDETGLSENIQYTRYVKAYNSYGESASSSATSTYTLADTPTNLVATNTTDQTITLSVDALPNATSGSSGYYFTNNSKSTNSGWLQTNSWSSTGLACGTSYTYTVKYRNGDSVETSTAALTKATSACSSSATSTAVSYGDATHDDNIDKEATPTPPTKTTLNPQGDFSIVVNGDAEYTNTRTVKLKLLAGSDTKYMLVSENPNFTGAVQEKYAPDKTWTLSRSDGKKTIYAKFLTLYDVASEVISDSIILDTTAPNLFITDPKNYSSLTDSTPTIKGTSEPDASIVLELQTEDDAKSYYSTETDQEGTFEYTFLFPLKNGDYTLNITSQDQARNLSKAQTIHFKIQTQKVSLVPELPTLTPLISPPAEEEQAITPPSIPEEQPSPEQEEAVPSIPEKEVSLPPLNLQFNLLLFKSLYGNISLKTPLTLISGQKLKAFLKPEKPVKAVKITIIFQKPAEKDTSYETAPTPSISPSGRGSSLLSSILGIPSAQAQTWRIAEYTLTDENKDGIYEGEITLPETTGTYLIRTTLFYADGTLENLDTETLIDPKGYIYTPAKGGQETRVKQAEISLYVFNSETSEFELWQSTPYGQENPQTTDKTGEYEFLVPEGKYYLQITTKGYQTYKGEEFQAKEGDVIHQNIELKPEKRINNRFLIMGSVVLILVIGAGIGFWKKRRG